MDIKDASVPCCEWQHVGCVAVDTGCLLLIDPSYDRPTDLGMDLALRAADLPCTEVALSDFPLHSAIACITGIGDGIYPVSVRMAPSPINGAPVVAELRVQFLAEDPWPREEEITQAESDQRFCDEIAADAKGLTGEVRRKFLGISPAWWDAEAGEAH